MPASMAMTTLTKDQVRNLTPEQQEAVGELEAQHVRSRQQLLDRVRRGMTVPAGLLTGLAAGLVGLSIPIPRALPFAIIAVIALVAFHASRLHRRLDALLELLDEEKRKSEEDAQRSHRP